MNSNLVTSRLPLKGDQYSRFKRKLYGCGKISEKLNSYYFLGPNGPNKHDFLQELDSLLAFDLTL